MSSSTENHHFQPVPTNWMIDVSHISSQEQLKKMAKNADKLLEEKLEEIEELEYAKRTWLNCDRLYEAKDRADYIEAFAFAIYQQMYALKKDACVE